MNWLDHDNRVAVLWGITYCASLVLVAGAFDALGLTPSVTLPVVVIVLPFLTSALISVLDHPRSEEEHG